MHILIIFEKLVGRLCCVDKIVPVAIHNHVAIKLLVFGLLYLTNMLYTPVLFHFDSFCIYISLVP